MLEFCPNKKHSFEPFMSLGLVLEREQSLTFQIFPPVVSGNENGRDEHQATRLATADHMWPPPTHTHTPHALQPPIPPRLCDGWLTVIYGWLTDIWVLDSSLTVIWVVNCEIWVVDCDIWVVDCDIWVVDWYTGAWLLPDRDMGSWLQYMGGWLIYGWLTPPWLWCGWLTDMCVCDCDMCVTVMYVCDCDMCVWLWYGWLTVIWVVDCVMGVCGPGVWDMSTLLLHRYSTVYAVTTINPEVFRLPLCPKRAGATTRRDENVPPAESRTQNHPIRSPVLFRQAICPPWKSSCPWWRLLGYPCHPCVAAAACQRSVGQFAKRAGVRLQLNMQCTLDPTATLGSVTVKHAVHPWPNSKTPASLGCYS